MENSSSYFAITLISLASNEMKLGMYNCFQELSLNTNIDSDNIENIYNNLIKANEEVSKSIIPKKPKSHKNSIKSDEKFALAREDLKRNAYLYHSNASSSNKIMLETAKKSLDKAYLDAQVDFVNGKMD